MNKSLLLQNLLFMNFGGNLFVDYTTEHCFAMKTAASLGRCNRVYNSGMITSNEIIAIKDYFRKTNFTWIVDSADQMTITLLEKHGLNDKGSFPAMIADLRLVKEWNPHNKIAVKEITQGHLIFAWIFVVTHVYHYHAHELTKALHSLIARAPQGTLKFYLGFYENELAATSMAIYHGDTMSLHMVGTLPEYRSKGMGYAISSKPLTDACKKGYTTALLMASPLGLPLSKKLGFREYAPYKIYGNY